MSDRLALAATAKPLDPAIIERVLLHGDLRQLSPDQKISYYTRVCESLDLNPLTRPFAYLTLSGKEVLYATKDATEQLRFKHGISVTITSREVIEGCYVVTAAAAMPNGRKDESTGVVWIEQSKGEARANLYMKAETKAKRRVTLSICGLGMLDESEIASIPGATPLDFDPSTGEVKEPAKLTGKAPQNSPVQTPAPTPTDQDTITEAQRKKLWAVARKHGWTEATLKAWLHDIWGHDSGHAILKRQFDRVLAQLETDKGKSTHDILEQEEIF